MKQHEIDLVIHTTMQYLAMAKNNLEHLRCQDGVGKHLRKCLYDSPVRYINSVIDDIQKNWEHDKFEVERDRRDRLEYDES